MGVFNIVGARGETELKKALVSRDPKTMCRPSSSLADLFKLVCDHMLQSSSSRRAKPSQLLKWEGFRGIETAPKPSRDDKPENNKPPANNNRPVPPVVKPVTPVIETPQEPTFLDKCHDSKQFWFKNLAKCCLTEKYDAKREAVCMRPCGPRVGYHNGQCAAGCQATSSGQYEFSKSKYCCVALVWKNKCIYPEYIPSGEGWRWMKDENL